MAGSILDMLAIPSAGQAMRGVDANRAALGQRPRRPQRPQQGALKSRLAELRELGLSQAEALEMASTEGLIHPRLAQKMMDASQVPEI